MTTHSNCNSPLSVQGGRSKKFKVLQASTAPLRLRFGGRSPRVTNPVGRRAPQKGAPVSGNDVKETFSLLGDRLLGAVKLGLTDDVLPGDEFQCLVALLGENCLGEHFARTSFALYYFGREVKSSVEFTQRCLQRIFAQAKRGPIAMPKSEEGGVATSPSDHGPGLAATEVEVPAYSTENECPNEGQTQSSTYPAAP